MLNPLILNICRFLQRKKTSIPTVGQWYTTPAGHVLRVSLVDREIPGGYTVQAPYKAGAGVGVLELIKAIYDAPASFLSSAFA
ncbi:hypothetical protein FQ005_25240, partial [Escherichia coli]|nr:hypothetical protein [Escherichia coli]